MINTDVASLKVSPNPTEDELAAIACAYSIYLMASDKRAESKLSDTRWSSSLKLRLCNRSEISQITRSSTMASRLISR